jgi:hypothetical protein
VTIFAGVPQTAFPVSSAGFGARVASLLLQVTRMNYTSRWCVGRAPMSLLLLLVVAFLASCSTRSAGDGPQVWKADSRHLEVVLSSAFSFGVLRLRADRKELSAEDLTKLEMLALVDPAPGCLEDADSYQISVTGADGTVATYRANVGDGACSDPRPLVAYSTFEPLRQAIPCLSPKLIPGPWRIPTLVPDARCRDEMQMNEGTTSVPFEIGVAGDTRHIELDQCDGAGRAESLHAAILLANGTEPLAQATAPANPGPDHTCLQIDHTFGAAGAYRLEIVADPGFPPDRDFYLRSY